MSIETIASAMAIVSTSLLIRKEIAAEIEKRRNKATKKLDNLVMALFPENKGDLHVTEGKSLGIPIEKPDPEDSAATLAIYDIITQPRKQRLRRREVADGIPIKLNSCHWLTGSLPSNPVTQALLGYKTNKDIPSRPVDYYIDYNVPLEDSVQRYFNGNIWKAGNWKIRSKTDKSLCLDIKKIDRKGFQKEDYLLISKVPNWLSDSEFNYYSVIIQGVHGIGTLAFRNVIENAKILDEIYSEVKPAEYWQAIIHVNNVKNESPQSTPRRIDFVNAVRLNIH